MDEGIAHVAHTHKNLTHIVPKPLDRGISLAVLLKSCKVKILMVPLVFKLNLTPFAAINILEI